jgi:putative membrane protein
MRYGTLIIASAATLALAGCGSKTETTSIDNTTVVSSETDTTNTTIPAPVPLSPGQAFANAAASSDAFEIATSQLAQTASTSAAIKAFAGKMIEAHTGSTEKLKTAAAGASPAITPDPTLTTEQQSTLDNLKTKTGADFDAAYKAAQVDGHQKTLDALKAYSATGDVPQLKTLATGLVPTVTAHLNMAKGLKG